MSDDGWLYKPDPPEWPFPPPKRCPGCTVMVYMDSWLPDAHYSFCSIMHPKYEPQGFVTGIPLI